MLSEIIKPLQLVGQAAEFKFESKFEPGESERNGFTYIHIKMEFFHLSVGLNGQGGWKLHNRPRFDS